MDKRSAGLAMFVGGVVLYGVSSLSEAHAEMNRPTPRNVSKFSAHPWESLGGLAGAMLATFGLMKIKPSYGAYGFVAYVVAEASDAPLHVARRLAA